MTTTPPAHQEEAQEMWAMSRGPYLSYFTFSFQIYTTDDTHLPPLIEYNPETASGPNHDTKQCTTCPQSLEPLLVGRNNDDSGQNH